MPRRVPGGLRPQWRRWAVLVGLAVALAGWAWREIGEPGRRAARVQAAIQPGMDVREVESLLDGRYYVWPQVRAEGSWQTLDRATFLRQVAGSAVTPLPEARLVLHFLGRSPRRVSLVVELDPRGQVARVGELHGWD